MEKIIHYSEKDQKLFEKCLRRIDAALLEEGNQSFSAFADHPEALENEFSYILKEDGRVKSLACLSDDVLSGLFPKSKRQMALFDLYDEIGIQEERVLIINCFGSDPADWEKGYMGRLFLFLTSSFKNVSWLALVPMENQKAAHFLWRRGYISIKQSDSFEGHEGKMMALFANKLRRKGLASVNF